MSKFNVHVEQVSRTVSIRFSGEFPGNWRGRMVLFEASNGVWIVSVNQPELYNGDYILTPGTITYNDPHIASVRCDSFEEATILYNKVVEALIEWSESRSKKN